MPDTHCALDSQSVNPLGKCGGLPIVQVASGIKRMLNRSPRDQGLTVKEAALEFFPPHEVVGITPIPPETKVVPPPGGLNTETGTVPGCAMSAAGITASS